MKRIERYQVRGVPGFVERRDFSGRRVDFWAPSAPTSHVLIAHDGQNVFDHRTATRHRTWKMAQSAINVSNELGIAPPAIIAVFHSRTPDNPWGRIIDLAPQDPFQNGVQPAGSASTPLAAEELMGNAYLAQITDVIAPTIADEIGIDLAMANKALIGSSMGGLATLYGLGKRPDFFTTGLALSTHWIAGNHPLVDALVDLLPKPGTHKIWMSHGTRGHDAKYGPFQKHADARMKELGWQLGKDFETRVYQRSGHNERSWARYLDQPMKFWLS
jgi:predicted alpha/beta superfamily hydrolase